MCLLDAETTHIIDADEAWCRLFDYACAHLQQLAIDELVIDTHALNLACAAQGTTRARWRRRDGSGFLAEVGASRLHVENKEIIVLSLRAPTTARSDVQRDPLKYIARTTCQQAALLRLFSHQEQDFVPRIRRILRTAAETLNVACASYWALSKSSALICCESINLESDASSIGSVLTQAEHPRYFAALLSRRLIATDDPRHDPRTAELYPRHLQPHHIAALIDVPVVVRDEVTGVLRLEHVGQHRWTVDEQQFAALAGTLTTLAAKAQRLERTEQALRESETRFRTIVEAAPIPMVVVTVADGRCLYGNGAAANTLGLAQDELVGSLTRDFYLRPEQRETVLTEIAEKGRLAGRELELKRADGSPLWALLSIEPIPFEGTNALIIAFSDVSRSKQIEDKLRHIALHDPLTGLPNRALLHDMLRREIAHARRTEGYRFAALFVDLDAFKEVNDTLGHDAGDELLVRISSQMQACLRPKDVLARMAGDEFTALLTDVTEPAQVYRIAERLLAAVAEPRMLRDQPVRISASVGVALNHPIDDEHTIVRRADRAMYRAKEQGKARFVTDNLA